MSDAPHPIAETAWAPPERFEEYRIVRALGAGAMGRVYLAHDTLLDRPVAIKFVGARDVGAAVRERFFIEARAVARLAHPNVVAIHRVGELARRPYLVSEYVRGTSLAALPRPVPWERALRIGAGLARGLAAAHRRGVLHRDLKPANVMLDEQGEAKLLDFGLAVLADATPHDAAGRPDIRRPDAAPSEPRTAGGDSSFGNGVGASSPSESRPHDGDSSFGNGVGASSPSESRPHDGNSSFARGAAADATTSIAAGRATTSLAREGAVGGEEARAAVGRIVGTPLYLAPELWQGGEATQASDVYALGVVLYELLAGRAPHAGVGVEELAARVVAGDRPSIADVASDVPARFAALVEACLAREPRERPESADVLAEKLEGVVATTEVPAIEGSPYRGLSSFESEHRAVFFGRTEDTRAVVERLRTETFVVVAGDSGAGKSSLCRAAVLPAIAEKAIAKRRWRTATMVPGAHPRARLEEALALRSDDDDGLLLFVDQLEELLTVAEPGEAEDVAVRLAGLAVAGSGVRILASARSDFLGRLAALPALGELIGRALYLLGPLGDRGLRDAIAGPARALGFELAPELVDDLVVSGRRNLPLLQFTLAELWDARDDRTRTIPAGALEQIGGVGGALARRADQVMAALGDDERELAWRVFVRLATAEGTRAVMSRRELGEVLGDAASAERVVERLVGARLLSVADGGERVEVVHEALLTNWPRLVAWRRTHEEGARMRDQCAEAARAWDRQGRPRGLLWRGDALADYRAWRRRWAEPPTGLEAAFAEASESEERRTRRLRVTLFSAIVTVLAIGIVFLYRSDRRAEAERDEALAQRRALLVEHGAQELAAGHPARALVYLVEALRQGEDTPALRVLIAAASRPVERQVLTIRDLPAGYTGAAWSPDGKHIAATAMDGTAVIYDRTGGRVRETHVPVDKTALFWGGSVAFAPSGMHLTFSTSLRTYLWNLETGAVVDLGVLSAYPMFIGERLVGLTKDTLRTWRFDGSPDHGLGAAACYTRVQDRLLTVDHDGVIATMDADGVRTPRAKVAPLLACVVQAGGERVALGAIRGERGTFDVALFEGSDFRSKDLRLHDSSGFLLNGDGTKFASTDSDGVRVWDLAFGRSVYAVPLGGANDAVFGVFDHLSRRLVAFGNDRVHRVIDLVDLRLAWEYEATTTSPTAPHATARTLGVVFSPDDKYLLTVTGNEISLQHGDRAPLVDELTSVNAFTARLSPNEREVALGQHGSFQLWELANHTRTALAELVGTDTRTWNVTWSPDGERVALCGGDGRLEIYSRRGELLRHLDGRPGSPSMNGVAWDETGRRLVSATDDGAAFIWDAATGERLATLPHPATRVMTARWFDDLRVMTATWDGALRVWNAETRTVETEIRDDVLRFLDASPSPDRTRIAATTHSGVVGVWDLATKGRILTLTGHMGSVTTVSWSPDGALLATSGIDGTARVWDAKAGRQLASYPVRGEALDVSWTRDGESIVVAGGYVRVWGVHRDTRTLAELDALLAARVPWRLVDGRLELVR